MNDEKILYRFVSGYYPVFMAACGKNDTQAQTPSHQAEPSATERSSQSDSLNGSENAGEASVAMDSTETVAEVMSGSTIVDETESMAEAVEAASEGKSVQEIRMNERATATARPRHRPGILSYTMGIRLLFSTAPIPGAIQDGDILMI